jgi:hypothetical protein
MVPPLFASTNPAEIPEAALSLSAQIREKLP